MSTASRLPRVASWLLRRLTSGPHRESLIGDLDEEFARGRSSAWYWRQVVSAIVVGVTRDLGQHPWGAIRPVMLTWIFVIAWVESTWTLYLWVSDRWVYAWVNHSVALFEFWIPFGGGLCIIWCVGSAVSGWVSARWSGGPRAAMVTASVLAQMPWILWWTRPVWLHADTLARLSARLWLPNYVWAAIVIIGMPTCTFVGGLLGVDDRPFPPPAR